MKWYLKALNEYANFRGRARRKEYWYFTLFQIIFYIVAIVIDNLVNLTFDRAIYGYLSAAFTVATIVPSYAVLVRRLHDIGKSGWYLFAYLIPLIGGLIILVFAVTDSEWGDNQYGRDPKADERGSGASGGSGLLRLNDA